MEKPVLLIFILLVCLLCLGAGCTAPSSPPGVRSSVATPVAGNTTVPQAQTSAALTGLLSLRVDSLVPGSTLPDIYTCKGAGESPGISFEQIPSGTKSLVLILDDPDAPAGTFTHWIVYNIPPSSTGLSQGQPDAKVLPDGSQQGETSAGSRGYYSPCPPSGTPHHYVFHLYAVDMDIVQPVANRDSINLALTGHTLGQAEVMTVFGR
ncbi:YbhB/YbcL family Raf kinase inhibitor-like protein [uncultured Methanoregula sp.]|uniref:YbhB/YbcL family Raf kinase inhibitor-like protein n=1 Tax=uncultured Methanoregula sp. TaxID=1005933 RepID=UPI002AAA73BF|nr:YbhB/YbcL family Raf kinase inhibitor-like protein [uncultured Methanoregula sp.]